MTELVLKIEDQNDLHLLLNLVKRLGISVQQKTITTEKTELEKLQAIIKKGVPHSSFGDAAEYQREVRQDRKLPYRN